MNKLRVLIVEDEWLVAEEHKIVLEEAGYEIVGPVPSVRRAILLIETEVISAAVLDIGLNGETSAPLVPYLEERAIPFIFASGYAHTDVPEALRLYALLPKPVIASALVAAVHKMVEQAEAQGGAA